MFAANVRAGESEFVAQKIAEQQSRLNFPFEYCFVDRHGHS
jgi:hypothetical protein